MAGMFDPWLVPVAWFAAGFLLARAIYRKPATPPAAPQDVRDEDIDAALRARRTIEAIKLYRAQTGCDLRTAKAAVERRARRLDVLQ